MAYHGDWCRSRTWPTKCPSCRDPVFFFSCNCGSKVFFDSLGSPWPEHQCGVARATPLDSRDADGNLFVELVDTPYDPRFQRWRERIDENVAVRARERRAGGPQTIVRVAPRRGKPREVLGVVREPFVPADPFESFGMPASTMARAMLGPLGNGPVARGTIHVPATDAGDIESYTIWMRITSSRRDFSRDSTVLGSVRMLAAGKDHVWWSDDLTLVTRTNDELEASDG